MEINEYKRIMLNTMKENYPEYLWINMFKFIENKGELRYDGRGSKQEGILDLTVYDSNSSKLHALFQQLDNVLKFCEEFEYERGYRYSSLYKYENIDFSKINDLKSQNRLTEFTSDNLYNDKISYIISNPTLRYFEDKVYLKFSLKLSHKIEEDCDLKHVILAIINKSNKTIEIRQNTIPIVYKNKDKIYEYNTCNVKLWIQNNLNAYITDLDLQSITRFMKSNKENEVKITALSLKRHGMEADLDSASNSELTLPILDELRDIILKEEVFHKEDVGKKIKKILEDFMIDIEERSDLPAAKIFWPGKDIRIHMFHGEVSSSTAMLKWLGKLKDRESMDYVAKYIINNETELRKSFED